MASRVAIGISFIVAFAASARAQTQFSYGATAPATYSFDASGISGVHSFQVNTVVTIESYATVVPSVRGLAVRTNLPLLAIASRNGVLTVSAN